MSDLNYKIIEKSIKKIAWSVGKLINKGSIEGTVENIVGKIKGTTELSEAKSADFVFEAVIENLKTKRSVFSKIDKICPPHTFFASNTSAIPITEIAEATERAGKVVGTHFFSPVPMMQVVEIVRGLLTTDETVRIAERLCQSLGKETIRVNSDVAGFALNRINFPSTIEAIKLVEAGIVSVEDVDKGMRLGFGRPMGPFETSDMVGLDVGFDAMSTVYEETQDAKFYPPTLLQRKIKIGQLGKKTGRGWYKYDDNGKKVGPVD
jgi:3-hydroxybutyryl-CoA dehydrogenase